MTEEELKSFCITLFDIIIDLSRKDEIEGLSNYLFNLSDYLLRNNNTNLKKYLEENKNGKI